MFNTLTSIITEQRAWGILARWEYIIWYLFLIAWMQGMAALNVMWGLLLIASTRHMTAIPSLLRPHKWLLLPMACYEVLRVLTTLFAQFPGEAVIGLFDDFRAITIGLAALVFLHSQQEIIRAAWLSFVGVTLLSWWSLGWQLWQRGLQPSGDIIYGTFAHLNYSATYSMIAMLIMLYIFLQLSFKRGRWLLLGIVPIAIMQVPLGSRMVLLSAGVGVLLFILIKRSRKALLIAALMIAVIIAGLASVPNGLGQFGSANAVERQISGEHGMPSLQIRLEIWGLLLEIVNDHPLGVGPRNHGFIDLNPYRNWIKEHMSYTVKTVYQVKTNSPDFETLDLNHHPLTYDPHSQYMDTLVDTGVLGVLALLALFIMPLIWFRRYQTLPILRGAIIIVIWMLASSGVMTAIFHQAGLIIYLGMIAFFISTIEVAKIDRQHYTIENVMYNHLETDSKKLSEIYAANDRRNLVSASTLDLDP